MNFFLFLVLLAALAYIYRRLRRAEDRLDEDQYERNRDADLIASLTRRVWALEKSQTAPAPPTPAPVSPPAAVEAVRPPLTLPLPEPARLPEPAVKAPELSREPAPVARTWRDQFRDSMGGQEWEAVVGGNWLNKLGVLVLVIGIALLLGYEFTRVGPVGRVATGLAVGLTMLIGGVLVERKNAYAVFARGLIGGGWAALYFTTYAMHALPAAKLIDNPYLATAVLLAVACGMISHSLLYRSQTVSGLAYFIAFATLALSESTPFSVLALLPLAASLLYLAQRFEWNRMAVFGLFATYATCASRRDIGAPLESEQALFAMYWLLFETFDLLRLRRSTASWTIESLIMPLNAFGFLALSVGKWERSAPEYLYAFLAGGAALYLASALLRARMRPPSAFDEPTGTVARIGGGSYEGSITLSAGLAAATIFLRASGTWINVGLLIEGETLLVAGALLGQRYLRRLAGTIFAGSVIKTVMADPLDGASVVFAGRTWASWSPTAVLSSGVFYINRALRMGEGVLYSSAAAGLVAMVLAYETPRQYLSVAWLAFASLLFEVGFRGRKAEFRYQSYIVGALGTAAGLLINLLGVDALGGAAAGPLPWLPLLILAAIHYAAALRIALSNGDNGLVDDERKISWINALSAAFFLSATAWKLVPGNYLGIAWLLLGAMLFELGLRSLPKHFRWLSYLVSGCGLWSIFWEHIVGAQIGSKSDAIPLAVATAVCYSVSARVFRAMPERIDDWERAWCRDLYAAAGSLFAMTLVWLKLPAALVAPAWTVLGVALLEIGLRSALPRYRLVAHSISAAVCARLFAVDFAAFGQALQITYRTFTIVPIVASYYYAWWRDQRAPIPERERTACRIYLYASALLVTTLARFELGAAWAVVAWAFVGLALFEAGQLYKNSDLRWQSYAIALFSFLFTIEDLAESRVGVLVGALVAASFYAAQVLAPRITGGDICEGQERYARTFYSLLGSLQLAILLFYESSGGTLTMAWSVQALALLGAGFPLRDRVQRLSGLALFMLCVLKLFLYDLRKLETVNRILSFILLGLILVVVSWMYTRFRDRIQRYL